MTVIVCVAGAAAGLATNVPVADPDPAGMVHGWGEEETTCGAPLLVIVHGPAVSEGRPFTVTVTVLLAKPAAGVIVNDGATVNGAVPLSRPQVIVRVYAAPPTPLGPVPTTKEPYASPPNTWP